MIIICLCFFLLSKYFSAHPYNVVGYGIIGCYSHQMFHYFRTNFLIYMMILLYGKYYSFYSVRGNTKKIRDEVLKKLFPVEENPFKVIAFSLSLGCASLRNQQLSLLITICHHSLRQGLSRRCSLIHYDSIAQS